jgi:putative inorganic carbon (hco3(-)) transporter
MLFILLILVFTRPFICSLAFPFANSIHSLLLTLVLTVWFFTKGFPKTEKAIQYPLLLLLIALIISLIFSNNRPCSLAELYKYTTGVTLFLFASSLSEEEKKKIMSCLLISAVIISILAINQYFFGFRHLADYLKKHEYDFAEPIADFILRKRAFATFVTPNILGGYLAMIIPLALIHKKSVWLISLFSVALILSKSLGAGLSIFLAFILYFYLRKGLNKKRLPFLLVVLAMFSAVLISRMNAQKPHLLPSFSTLMRLDYWRQTLKIIQASPLVGVGIGNFDLTYSRYAHNSYLQIWAEMGILGLASVLWLVFVVFQKGLETIRNVLYKKQAAALITAAAVFLIHNLLDFSFFLPEVAFIWWLILGMCAAERYQPKESLNRHLAPHLG